MKKYLFLAILVIGGLTTSCTTDDAMFPISKTNIKFQEFDYSIVQRVGDSIEDGDTGGQGGSTPIKPGN